MTLISHQAVTHPTTVVGGTIDCSTKRSARIFLYHGYVEAAADTNPGSFYVQVRYEDGAGSVNESWVTVFQGTAMGTTPDTEALTGSEAAGDSSLAVASTTGFAIGDILYIQDTGVVADGEWAMLKTLVTNTNIQLIDGLTNAKDSADVIWNDARVWAFSISLEDVKAFRVVWSHEGATGANGHIKAFAVTYDSDSSA